MRECTHAHTHVNVTFSLPRTSRLFSFIPVKHRDRLLRKGKLQVVSELCSLPKTTHDAHSFVVDVNLLSVSMPCYACCGVLMAPVGMRSSRIFIFQIIIITCDYLLKCLSNELLQSFAYLCSYAHLLFVCVIVQLFHSNSFLRMFYSM